MLFKQVFRRVFYLFFICAVGLFWVLQPRMIGDGDCGEIGGMKIGRGNRNTRRNPAPVPLCPPQIPPFGVLHIKHIKAEIM
jgi:hypothetical protein